MFSKPVAVVLVVGALSAAAIAGGYIATKSLATKPDPDADLGEPVPVDETTAAAGSASSSGTAAPARNRPSPQNPQNANSAPAPAVPAAPAAGNAPSNPGPGGATSDSAANAAPSPAKKKDEAPVFEDVEVPAGQLLDVELRSPLSTETAKVEDRVEARVTKDVKVGATVAIASGALVIGSVTVADKGSRLSEAPRLGVRFHTLAITGEPELPLVIDPIIQKGPSPAGDSKLKIAGGAAAGVALGWLKGGVGGALKGGAVGGGAGTAAKVIQNKKVVEVPVGSQARLELRAPVTITVKK